MSDLIWLSEAQMRRTQPYLPLSHGIPRVDVNRRRNLTPERIGIKFMI
jgi:hypothetical protein